MRENKIEDIEKNVENNGGEIVCMTELRVEDKAIVGQSEDEVRLARAHSNNEPVLRV